MSEALLKRQRYAQSERELAQLRGEIVDWLALRTKADTHRQYVTQLRVLGEKFELMLGKLENLLGKVSQAGSARQLYGDCRDVDTRLLWVRRAYQWYRTKFDQRDDPRLDDVLAAADEIVWSCYAQPFRALKQQPPPVPLPFVDPTYSPFAIPRTEPPPDLRANIHATVLTELLGQLPVPVVAFPPNCLEEPWWLAFLAHEVGHHVLYDLLPDSGFVTALQPDIKAAAGARWQSWHHEVFADFYSVLMIGPWAAWALAELVWGADVMMLDDSNQKYPASIARLMFMEEVARQLKIDPTPALRGVRPADLFAGPPPAIAGWPDRRERIKKDTEPIPALVEALLNKVKPKGKKLTALCEFDAAEFNAKKPKGTIPLWADALRGEGEGTMKVRQDLRSVRVLLASGVQAWSRIVELTDDKEREQQRELLKTELLSKIVKSREEVTREAEKPAAVAVPEKPAGGEDPLLDLLMKLPTEHPGLA